MATEKSEEHNIESFDMIQDGNRAISYELKNANMGVTFEAHSRDNGLFLIKGKGFFFCKNYSIL